MEEEARRLYDGENLRVDFWAGVVEFVEGFIEKCHRRVEEEVIFPKLREYGDEACRTAVRSLVAGHGRAHALTGNLVQGINDADWEGVLRMATIYISNMRRHMTAEENAFEVLSACVVPHEDLADMRARVEAIEADGMGGIEPAHFVDIARVLCNATDVDGPILAGPQAHPGTGAGRFARQTAVV